MNMCRTTTLLFAGFAANFGGCTVAMSAEEITLRENHLVSFAYDGRPITPEFDLKGWNLGDQYLVEPHYAQQVKKIARAARLYLKRRHREGKSARVLVFLHGGLNGYQDSIDRLKKSAEEMKSDGVYPIFVAWNSDLLWSYFDNLVYADGSVSVLKSLVSPVAVVRDVATGIINIPVRAIEFAFDYVFGSTLEDQSSASVAQAAYMLGEASRFATGTARDQAIDKVRSRLFVDFPELPEFRPEGLGDFYYYDFWSPRNFLLPLGVASSFLVDAFGKGAWDGMLQRTKRLFDKEHILSIYREEQYTGLSLLMAQLRDLQSSLRVRSGETGLQLDRSQQGLELVAKAIGRLLDKLADPRYESEIDKLLSKLNTVRDKVLKSVVFQRLWDVIWGDKASGDKTPKTDPTKKQDPSAKQKGITLLDPIAQLLDPDLRDLLQWLINLALLPHEVAGATAALDVVAELFESGSSEEDRKKQKVFDEQLAPLKKYYLNKEKIESSDVSAVLRFVQELVRQRLADLRKDEVRVEIFAHSMGAIIVNEILRRSDRYSTPNFKRIVYMAPACSIRDYEDSVFPYLFRQKPYGTQFHNVMLHPKAEESEIILYDILPRGSLLVYIDEYLTNPGTRRDRTLGRFQNIMLSLDRTRAAVAGQIHMKVFSAGQGSKDAIHPEAHTEFAPARFWRKEFWGTNSSTTGVHR